MANRVAGFSIALALAGALVPVGLAWEAIPWGGTPTTWQPTPGREIVILAPGTYRFYATDGGPNGSLDEIVGVYADSEIDPGTVTVHIARDLNTGGGPGVSELGTIALSAASDSIVAECRVAVGGS
ncbi:MAG: hypothetical protein IPM13_14625 [Phycisphaerales bacterium]|nr:hypothetical protein [Phycisphaerales bacterium]